MPILRYSYDSGNGNSIVNDMSQSVSPTLLAVYGPVVVLPLHSSAGVMLRDTSEQAMDPLT